MEGYPEFKKFDSIGRVSRNMIITEKLDGTNAQIYITEDGEIFAGSRNRWLTEEKDNYGFRNWVMNNKEELLKLGEGRHYGEWWGNGIQIRYGLDHKKFSLFNAGRWKDNPELPECCDVVPVLFEGEFCTDAIDNVMDKLRDSGSIAAPGFMKPEGIVIWHAQARIYLKKTFEYDEKGKSYGA